MRSTTAVIAHDLMEDFSISASSLGLMSAVYFYIYGAVQIPVGVLSDRFGVKHTVFLFGIIGVAGTFLFAFSQNIQVAILARLLTGLGTAGIFVPALKYLSLSYLPREFASLTSVISSVGSFGLLFSSYPLAFLVERTNWRLPFILSSILLLALVISAWYLMNEKADRTKHQGKISKDVKNLTFKEHLSLYYKFIYFIIWAFFIYGVLFSFQMLWGIAYLQDVFSLSRETAGVILMFTSIGIIIGGPFWGLLSDRYLQLRKPILFWGTIFFLLTLLIFLFQTDYWGFYISALQYLSLGFFGSVFLINITSVKDFFPLNITGTALGILNTVMLFSVGFFQSITGLIIDYGKNASAFSPYYSIFLLYCISIFLAFLVLFFIPETFIQDDILEG